MHIEEILSSIDTTLKALLASVQSGVQMSASTLAVDDGEASETTKRTRRTKAQIAADEAAEAAAKAAPNEAEAPPADEAKKSAPTEAASSEPAATRAAAVATSASGSVSWDDVVTALKALATNPAHGADAVVKIVKEFDAKAANGPALKALNKNAEIVAAVNALLNPAATEAADPLFG